MTIGAPNAGEYRDCAERVAREVLGEPNCQLSNGKGLRWGSHGSMSLNVERGIFFDHERNEGGGVRWLVRRQLALDEKAIDEWLGARGYIKPRPNGDGQRKIVATYDYADETGAVLFQVVRFEPKEFRQRQPNGIWSVKGVRQVPYRLSAILEAIANDCPVVITEGEKDVDNLARWNVPATCNAGGAGKWRDEVNEHFRGADVVLIPDNDDAGYHHVHAVGAALIGVAKRIRVLMLPGLPVKGDVSDWIAAGGTVEQFWELIETAPDWVAHAAVADFDDSDQDAKKAKAIADEQRLVDELARLNQTDYDRRRTEAADELGIRRSTLDNAREARRAEIEAQRGPPPLFGHWVVEPSEESVDGEVLLLAIMQRIHRHIVLGNDQAITVALWILMAWVHHEAAVHSPILLATSAEANSGKTTLINLVGFLVPRGLTAGGISEAALFRSIERYEPVIIVDEADTLLIDNEPLRAVINSGWTRGSGVLRCIDDSNTPHLFPTFCPKAIGMKGRRLPDTTLSRCITIELKRKKRCEGVQRFKHIDDAGLGELRRQAMRWSMDHVEALKTAEPEIPPGFENRLEDNWRLLFAIADMVGAEWPKKARQAAMTVAKMLDAGEMSSGAMALSDIKAIFAERCKDQISSADLIATLAGMHERPWPEWRGGKPITQNALARLLRPYGIATGTIREGAATPKGYQLAHFQDAFERYL
jgi:hypothetical protein